MLFFDFNVLLCMLLVVMKNCFGRNLLITWSDGFRFESSRLEMKAKNVLIKL